MDDRFDLGTLLEAYRDEATEQLNLLDRALLRVEDSGELGEEERLELLRVLHTLKGNSAMVGIHVIAEKVHALEAVFKAEGPTGDRRQLDVLFELSASLRSAVDRLGTPEQDAALERVAAIQLGREPEGAAPQRSEPSSAADESPEPPLAPASGVGEVIRVPFSKLDLLLSGVGELVAFHARLEALIEAHAEPLTQLGLYRELRDEVEDLALRTDALRETTTSLRLVPLRNLFGPFPALVRELAREQGKRARLEVIGGNVELDKSAADALGEPLLHLVRNAVDHGLEPPAVRARAGKDEVGVVRLAASRQGDQIRIEVSDDGAGLDRAAILERARDAGLLRDEPGRVEEIVPELIFHPGFSTRTEASTVSGRGMGLDIVRRGVARLRGSLEVLETPGGGTTFALQFPLTLAIVSALIFESDGEILALPAAEVREALPPIRVEYAGGAEVVRHQEMLVPVARTSRIFGWRPTGEESVEAPFAIVLGKGDRAAALTADRLIDQRDIVVKALPTYLGPVRGLSGATVAPDGRVILLLDSQGVLDLNVQTQRGPSHAE